MAIKISFYNHKGGVGKTTDSLIFIYGLLNKGKRVLAVDLDPQQYLSLALLSYEQLEDESTLSSYDLISEPLQTPRPVEVDVLLLNNTLAKLHVIPTLDRDVIRKLKGQMPITTPHALRQVLQKIESNYDFIVIDMPPQVAENLWYGLVASDYIIIPVTTSDYSQYGVYIFIRDILPYITALSSIKTLGVLVSNALVREPEKFLKRVTSDLQEYTSKVFNQYPDLMNYIYRDIVFKSYIPQTNELREQIRGREKYPVIFETIRSSKYPPTEKVRDNMIKLADEVIQRVNNFVPLSKATLVGAIKGES